MTDGKQEEPGTGPGRQEGEKLNPLQVVSSVFAAGLGVQSSKNRERDFKQGKPGVFIAAGIVFTLLFIGAVFTVVQLVLKGAGD
jgi:hypothetical protein